MALPWNAEQILAMAPDASSASAGRALAVRAKWSGTGRSAGAIWGLCQGSGKEPYQARVDLNGPAFKCNCPSRKFPCKHGLGLLLLAAKEPELFNPGTEPGWVAEWLASRSDRAEKKAEKAAEATVKAVDPEAQAKRRSQRDATMITGVEECRTWIEDLVRRGLAAARMEPRGFWEQAAARMVDAQAPGLAAFIHRLQVATAGGEGWEVRALDIVGRMELLISAALRVKELSDDLATDVRTALGVAQSKEEALRGESVVDRWAVIGQATESDGRLRSRRTWLLGQRSGRRGLILDFAAGAQPLEIGLSAGTAFEGDVGFYPSAAPLRCLVKGEPSRQPIGPLFDVLGASVEEELGRYAEALAGNPWIAHWPMALRATTIQWSPPGWMVVDRAGRALRLRPHAGSAWRAISVSAGKPVGVAGEWDGEHLDLLSVFIEEKESFNDVAPRWIA